MPRDVELGEGYLGDEMVSQAMPGQHRGQFRYEDSGRVVLREEGDSEDIENVVAPTVRQRRIDMDRVLSDIPVEEPVDGGMPVSGFGEAKSFAFGRMESAAQMAVSEAVDRARRGIIKNAAQADEHIRMTLCLLLRDYMRTLCETVRTVYASASAKARPLVEKAIEEYGKSGMSGLDDDGAKWVPDSQLNGLGAVSRKAQAIARAYQTKVWRADIEREVGHVAELLGRVASEAAKRAVLVAGRTFKTVDEASAFIRGRVNQVAAVFPAAIQKAADEAALAAVEKIRPEFAARLAKRGVPRGATPKWEAIRRAVTTHAVEAPRASGDSMMTHEELSDITDDVEHRGVSGLGDVASSFSAMVAGEENLDKLRKGVAQAQDAIRKVIETRAPLLAGYRIAEVAYNEIKGKYGPELMGIGMVRFPNPNYVPALSALVTAQDAMKQYARQVHQSENLAIVFMRISEALTKAGLKNDANYVDQFTSLSNRFTIETGNLLRGIPAYQGTINSIIEAFKQELSAAGVAPNAYDDPRWYQAYLRAADKVVPLPEAARAGMGEFDEAVSGLGIEPVTISLIIAGIVKLVIVLGLIASVLYALSRLLPDANSKAKTARDLLVQRETDWTKIEAQMRAQGKSQAEIDAARKSWEAGTRKTIEEIPEPESPLVGLLSGLKWVALAGAAILVGSKVL